MKTLGHDIVDFEGLNKALDERFRNRVFTPLENQYIDKANDSEKMLWVIWASKEAAFKARQKQDLNTVFSHQKFALTEPTLKTLLGEFDMQLGEIQYEDLKIHLSFFVVEACVCGAIAICSDEGDFPFDAVCLNTTKRKCYEDESFAVRELAYKVLQMKGYDEAQIIRPLLSIHKKGPPEVWHHGHKEKIEVSLSHDNLWVSTAILDS